MSLSRSNMFHLAKRFSRPGYADEATYEARRQIAVQQDIVSRCEQRLAELAAMPKGRVARNSHGAPVMDAKRAAMAEEEREVTALRSGALAEIDRLTAPVTGAVTAERNRRDHLIKLFMAEQDGQLRFQAEQAESRGDPKQAMIWRLQWCRLRELAEKEIR